MSQTDWKKLIEDATDAAIARGINKLGWPDVPSKTGIMEFDSDCHEVKTISAELPNELLLIALEELEKLNRAVKPLNLDDIPIYNPVALPAKAFINIRKALTEIRKALETR